MVPKETEILEALYSFEFLPRLAGEGPLIERHMHPPFKCAAFRIVFPIPAGLSGSIFVISNIHPITGDVVVPYAKVEFEVPGTAFNKTVPYEVHWRKILRGAVGLYAALAREKIKPRPSVNDFPDNATWLQACSDTDAENHVKYTTAQHRWKAYECRQISSAILGQKEGCIQTGALGVSRWLKECGTA